MEKWKKLAIGTAVAASFTIPIFRSGGRTHLTFWQWVWNHTIFGPPIEYVPEEDYRRELEGVEIPKQLPLESQLERAKAYYQISEPSARKLLSHQKMSWQRLDTRTVTLSPVEAPAEWTLLDRRYITIYPKEEEIPPVGWVKLDTRHITISPEEEIPPPPPPVEWTKLDTKIITLTPTEVVPPVPPPEKKFPWAPVIIAVGAGIGVLGLLAVRK